MNLLRTISPTVVDDDAVIAPIFGNVVLDELHSSIVGGIVKSGRRVSTPVIWPSGTREVPKAPIKVD